MGLLGIAHNQFFALRGEYRGKLLKGEIRFGDTQTPRKDQVLLYLAFIDEAIVESEESPDVSTSDLSVELLALDLNTIC